MHLTRIHHWNIEKISFKRQYSIAPICELTQRVSYSYFLRKDQGSVIILQLGKTNVSCIDNDSIFTVGFLQYAPALFVQVCSINALLLAIGSLVPTARYDTIHFIAS